MKQFQNLMNQAIDRCKDCENCTRKGGVYISHDLKDIDFFFIGQNPGASNLQKNIKAEDIIPFGITKRNGYNRFFYKLFDEFSSKFNKEAKYYITNIIKTITQSNKVDDINMIEICTNKFLFKELIFLKPKLIITLGSLSKNIFEKKFNKYKFISCYHPGYLNRQSNEFMNEEINKILEVMYESSL